MKILSHFQLARTFALIHFVTTRTHRYTLINLVNRKGFESSRIWSYEYLFLRRRAPGGLWIFTDIERLSAAELETAAMLATDLQQGGAIVLNHPARVQGRFETLRRLKQAGINRFSAWRAESDPSPDQFPVFIRNEYDHRQRQFDLIYTQNALNETLRDMVCAGSPLRGKLVIEYLDAQILPKIWHRASAFRVGAKVLTVRVAFGESWVVKDGFSNDDLNARQNKNVLNEIEREFLLDDRHDAVLSEAFNLAGIDYGRADLSIRDGRLDFFEINTNPNHAAKEMTTADAEDGSDLLKRAEQMMEDAILQLNESSEEMIDLRTTERNADLDAERKRIFGPSYLWRP